MENKYTLGQRVTVYSSIGPTPVVVTMDLGEVILVCRPEEFEASTKEHRAPVSVGFKKRDIVDFAGH